MIHSHVLELVLRCASRLVPSARRTEWLAEWESELWHAMRSRPRGRLETLCFTLGAFNDARWVWSQSTNLSPDLWLRSPRACLIFLSTLAALCVVSFIYAGNPAQAVPGPNQRNGLGIVFQIVCALLILPAVTTVSVGRTFEVSQSPARKARIRRRAFTSVRFVLVVVIACFGALEFTPSPIRPVAILAGCVLGFRWLLQDHRLRCPICSRRLIRLARVGSASHTFLDNYGTELCCDKGHGIMCQPDAVTNYTAQRWSDSA